MAHTSMSPPARRARSLWHEAPLWMHLVVIAIAALLASGVVFISTNWPYRHRKIAAMLEDVLASQVTFSNYHRTYFPHPGFVATGITMRRKSAPNLPPLGSVETLFVQGSWLDLVMLRERVRVVDLTGLHIVVPAIGSPANHEDFPPGSSSDFTGPDTRIERLVVHKSLLDIMRKDGRRFSFAIAELEIRNLHKGAAMTYAVDMRNALPTGRIEAHGGFGPINAKDMGSTPISGEFAFQSVNLHDVGDISGALDSRGHFKGVLEAIGAEASSNTPDFAVDDGKPTPVQATIECIINAINGDLKIRAIEAKIGATNIHAEGEISGSPKVTKMELGVTNGRAEDVMRPFVHQDVPISGPVWLKGHAYIGPPGDGFLERLRVDGVFDVPAERISDRKTEKSVSEFSQRAQGKPSSGDKNSGDKGSGATDALSSIKGPVAIRNGVASTTQLTFQVAGAEAVLNGTFNFHNSKAHLVGNLKMDSDISHAETGFKSWLLKPLDPFFKKKHAGAVVPIAITGTEGNYKVSQDLTHAK